MIFSSNPSEEYKGNLCEKEKKTKGGKLLCNWKWRLIQDQEAIWLGIIKHRYGDFQSGSSRSRDNKRKAKDSICCCDIEKMGQFEDVEEDIFHKSISCKVGDGVKMAFWRDRWIRGDSLANQYPELYSKSINHEGKLVDNGHWREDYWVWDVQLIGVIDGEPTRNLEDEENLRITLK